MNTPNIPQPTQRRPRARIAPHLEGYPLTVAQYHERLAFEEWAGTWHPCPACDGYSIVDGPHGYLDVCPTCKGIGYDQDAALQAYQDDSPPAPESLEHTARAAFEVEGGDQVAEAANAHLIAAAPELLEFAKWAFEQLINRDYYHGANIPRLDAAEVAITKAEGGTP